MNIEGGIASVEYVLELFLCSEFFGLRGLSVPVENYHSESRVEDNVGVYCEASDQIRPLVHY